MKFKIFSLSFELSTLGSERVNVLNLLYAPCQLSLNTARSELIWIKNDQVQLATDPSMKPASLVKWSAIDFSLSLVC